MILSIRHISRRLSHILGSSTPWVFLISAVALGLLTNGLSGWIIALWADGRVGGLITAAVGGLLLLLAVVFFNLPRRVGEWVARLARPRSALTLTEQVPPRRGLVALVSPGPIGSPQTRFAMEYYLNQPDSPVHLARCWLIAGPGEGEDSSLENAARLKADFEPRGVQVEVVPLFSSEDPKAVFDAVVSIYQAADTGGQMRPEEMIADFTAGTKLMTTGMALACSAHGWVMQFMKPDRYDAQGRAAKDARATPVIVNMDFFPSSAGSVR